MAASIPTSVAKAVIFNAFIEWAKANKTKFGNGIITNTEPTWKSKKCPYVGRVRKITLIPNVRFGSYEEMVNARRAENTETFKAQVPMWFEYAEFPYWGVNRKNPDNKYVRINLAANWARTTPQPIYFLDGKKVENPETLKAIKGCIREHTIAKTQEAAGLTTENEVVALNYKAESIVSFGTFSQMKTIFNSL